MNKIDAYTVWLKFLKKTGTIFLVFAFLVIQIPDAFWQQLHTHEHHDCGLLDVIHKYTPDCNLEQRFISPWKSKLFKPLSLIITCAVFIIYSNLITDFQQIKFKLINNKSPPCNYFFIIHQP